MAGPLKLNTISNLGNTIFPGGFGSITVNQRRLPQNTSSFGTVDNNQFQGTTILGPYDFVSGPNTVQEFNWDSIPTFPKRSSYKSQRNAALSSIQRERRKEYIRAFANPEGITPDVPLNYIYLDDPNVRLSPYGLNYQEALNLGLIDPIQGSNWNLYRGFNNVTPQYYVPTAIGSTPQMIAVGGRGTRIVPVMAATQTEPYGMTTAPAGTIAPSFWSRATSGLKKVGKKVTSFFGGRSKAVPAPLTYRLTTPSQIQQTVVPTNYLSQKRVNYWDALGMEAPVVGGRSTAVSAVPTGTVIPGTNLRTTASPGVWKKFLTRAQSTWNTAKTAGKELVTIGGRGLNTAGRYIGRGIKKAGLAGYDVITGTALPSFITGTGESLRNVKQKIFAGGRSTAVPSVPAISIAPTRVTGLNPQGEQYNPFGDSEYEKILTGFESSPRSSAEKRYSAERKDKLRLKALAKQIAESTLTAAQEAAIKRLSIQRKKDLARELVEEAAKLSPASRARLENFFREGIENLERQRINKEYLEKSLKEEARKRRAAEVEGMPSVFNLSPDYEEARRNIYLRPEDELLFKSIARKAAINIKPKAQKGAAAALSRRLSAEDRERRKNEFMKNKERLQEIQNMSPLGLRNSPDLEEANRTEIKRRLNLNKLYDDKRKELDKKIIVLKNFMKGLRDKISGKVSSNLSYEKLKNKLETTKLIHDNLNDKYLIANNYFVRNEISDAIKTLDNALQEYNNILPILTKI
jgi:hypothetical protein